MGSLRIALKQSLQDATTIGEGGSAAEGAPPALLQPQGKSKKGKFGGGKSNNEDDSGSSSEENEASLKNLQEDDDDDSSSIEEDEKNATSHQKTTVMMEWSIPTTSTKHQQQQQHAAHQIQKHFRRSIAKNKKRKGSKSSKKRRRRSGSTDDDAPRTIEAPTAAVRQHMASLATDQCRQHMHVGLRVKVLFDHPTAQWYAGRVRRIRHGAGGEMHILIRYDDGTTEETPFPDRKYNDRGQWVDTVVVDAQGNGQHDAAVLELAQVFLPGSDPSTSLALSEPGTATGDDGGVDQKEVGAVDRMNHREEEEEEETADFALPEENAPSVSVDVDVGEGTVGIERDLQSAGEEMASERGSQSTGEEMATELLVASRKFASQRSTSPKLEETLAMKLDDEPTGIAVAAQGMPDVDIGPEPIVTATTTEMVNAMEPSKTTVPALDTTVTGMPVSKDDATTECLPETLEVETDRANTLNPSPAQPNDNDDSLEKSMVVDAGTQKEDTTPLPTLAATESGAVVGPELLVPTVESISSTPVAVLEGNGLEAGMALDEASEAAAVEPGTSAIPREMAQSSGLESSIEHDAESSTAVLSMSASTPLDPLSEQEVKEATASCIDRAEFDSAMVDMGASRTNEVFGVDNAVVASSVSAPEEETPILVSNAEEPETDVEMMSDQKAVETRTTDDPMIAQDVADLEIIAEGTSTSMDAAPSHVVELKKSTEQGDIGVANDLEQANASLDLKDVELNASVTNVSIPVERVKLTLSLKRPSPAPISDMEQPPPKKLTIRIPIPKVKPTVPVSDVALLSNIVNERNTPKSASRVTEQVAEGKSKTHEEDVDHMELDAPCIDASVASPRQLKKLEKKKKKLLAASTNLEINDTPSVANDGTADANDVSSIITSKKISCAPKDEAHAVAEGSIGDVDYNLDGSVRSERKAALHANERISSKSDSTTAPQEEVVKKKKKGNRRKELEGSSDQRSNAESEIEFDDSQWVQCDRCGKWRVIPNSVVQLLPSQWYCSDNVYDPKHNSCDAPEQTDKDVAREKKKRLKKKQRLLKAAEEAAMNEGSTPKSENAKLDISLQKEIVADRSPRPPRDVKDDVEKLTKQQKRATPVDDNQVVESVTESRPKKEKKVSSLTVKRGRSEETLDKLVPVEEPVSADATKPRGRGRPRRVNNSTKEPAVIGSAVPTPTEDGENLEWVQCEKCDKWRKLPPHVSADDLPDVWTCDMNNWNPASASCDAPEDKSEGLQDIGVFGSSGSAAGKLTYRHLIFGSNGRKANRPVSEKTRAAESIFAVHLDEDDVPSKVLYSDSSAYVSRGRANLPNDENENLTVLELMSHSQLWQELRGVSLSALPPMSSEPQHDVEKMNLFVFDTLPVDVQDLMTEYVLYILGKETLFVNEVVRRALSSNKDSLPRKLQNAPSYCSENVVVTTLCELVKTGKAECIQKIGSSSSKSDWNPYYRRKMPRVIPKKEAPLQVAEPSSAHRSKFSHFMKLSKPWKYAH